MKMEPIIIDTNIVENRKRMRARDNGSSAVPHVQFYNVFHKFLFGR